MDYENTKEFALKLDEADELSSYRSKFHFPQHDGADVIYFTGNSLGLQPRSVKEHLIQELDDWAKHGVEGHFLAKNPWVSYHELFAKPLSKIVGSKESEIIVMNGLTTNLHLLFASFYRPTEKRYKILCEAKAFPSDQYAVASQVRFHGYDAKDAVIEIGSRCDSDIIEEDDIIAAIEQYKDELALVFIGGVNYYTGQVFDMERISKACKKAGITFGLDLAHAAGNVILNLHDWNVDFAAWCSYKYLNAGPGSVSGVFIHEKHHGLKDIPRFEGWWGHNKDVRFKMGSIFDPIPTAEAWQLSNAPIFSMAAHKASLEMFETTEMEILVKKQEKLTSFLEYVLLDVASKNARAKFEIITPAGLKRRGCQISVLTLSTGRELFDYLTKNGVIADWREPNVIRMAPVPLYNSFEDIWNFGVLLDDYFSH